MGVRENPLLAYYNQDERFAELMNGWLFRGRPFLSAQNISDADRRMDGRSKKGRAYRHRYRDLFKKLDHAMVRLCIGAELMEYVDYAMPLRIMDCDTLSYLQQKKAISKTHAEKKDLKEAEYLSQFSGEDRLCPVITLVLYCGEKPWDGARRLHELLDLHKLPKELKEYVEDYAVHILDVRHTPDERLREFPPDICFMLMCMKYAEDKEALLRLGELTGCERISEDTFEALEEYLDMPEFSEYREVMEGEGGKLNMASGFRKVMEEERKEGLEQGIRQGLSQGERSGLELARQIYKLAGTGISVQEIAGKLEIPEEKVRLVLE